MSKSPASISSAPPKRVGSYEFENMLGQGGMGKVWKGRHILLDEPIVIKELVLNEVESVEQFKYEAKILYRKYPAPVLSHREGLF